MNQTETLLWAIERLRPELPALVGADWPEFDAQLAAYLRQLETETDPLQRAILPALIVRLFERHPKARDRLAELMGQPAQIYREGAMGITKGATPPATVTRYTDIACPRRVWVQTPRISVVVRLTVARPEFSAAAQALELQETLPVRVRVDAPGLVPLNAAEQETVLLPAADSPPLVFDLRPERAGHTRITFDFFQAGNPSGTASVPVEVVAQPVDEAAEPWPGQALRVGPAAEPPNTMLFIAYERYADQPRLTFTLFRGGEVGRTFHPVALEGDPQTHAAALYAKLTGMASNRALPPDDVDRKLRIFGRNLWRDLIPDDLKAVYAAERLAWRGKSLLIVSDEPYFPWELVWPYDAAGAWGDADPWCTSLRLTRWLRRDDQGNGHEAPPGRLSLHGLACLAPTTSNLPMAQEERVFLQKLAAERKLDDLSPAAPARVAVLDLLEGGGYGWVHAATHGRFDADVPDPGTAIRLQGSDLLAPEDLVGPEIEGYIGRARPAFFFNVCHGGQQGWALTRLGGWANRLVSAGAGLFIAPLWSVTDANALTFAEKFYAMLATGETVGEAARAGRLAARAAGDPTWLAYSIYAHPNARVV